MARRAGVASLVAVAAATGWAGRADAEGFRLTLTGEFWQGESLGPANGTLTPFSTATPFTFTALFNTSSPNLVANKPWPGFVAYEPTSLTLSVGGNIYQVEPYNAVQSATGGPNGLSVAIFDYTTPFGNPAGETPGTTPNGFHVSVGLLQDPFHDGAGFTPDFLGSTPDINIAATGLQPATWTGSYGVGFGPGVCLSACRTPNEVDAVTPTPLTLNGVPYLLQWGSEDVTFAPYAGAQSDPTDPRIADGVGNTAVLTAAPEPGSLPLFGAALALLGIAWPRPRARA
jgi:hypothetical protein